MFFEGSNHDDAAFAGFGISVARRTEQELGLESYADGVDHRFPCCRGAGSGGLRNQLADADSDAERRHQRHADYDRGGAGQRPAAIGVRNGRGSDDGGNRDLHAVLDVQGEQEPPGADGRARSIYAGERGFVVVLPGYESRSTLPGNGRDLPA